MPWSDLLKGIPIIGDIGSTIEKTIPVREDEATVEIHGQPGSTKRDLYFLALAIACSLAKRPAHNFEVGVGANFQAFFPPTAGLLMIEYDAADNWVRATIRYKTSMAFAAISDLIVGRLRPDYPNVEVYGGPKETVIGAPFNFTSPLGLPGVPAPISTIIDVPLPWTGLTLLTTHPQSIPPDPSQPKNVLPVGPTLNPKPPGDNRSRGTINPSVINAATDTVANVTKEFLLPLVYSALTDPGSGNNITYPRPTGGPTGG